MEPADDNHDDDDGESHELHSKAEFNPTDTNQPPGESQSDNIITTDYAQIRPHILLEVLSAKSTRLIMLSTYSIFIFSFLVDFLDVVLSISNNNYSVSPAVLPPSLALASTYSTNITITSVAAVLAIQVSVLQSNLSVVTTSNSLLKSITGVTNNPNCTESMTYKFQLWACGQTQGCGSNFLVNSNQLSYHSWMYVYQSHQSVSVNVCDIVNGDVTTLQISLLPTHLQNQESYLTVGMIRSYLIQMTITDNPANLLVPLSSDIASSIEYTVSVQSTISNANRIVNSAAFSRAFYLITLTITAIGIIGFSWFTLSHERNPFKWLPEQRLVLVNLVVVILYLNPFFLILYDNSETTSATSYADILISLVGSAGFNMTWILFADFVRYRRVHWFRYWWFKVCLVLFIFISSLIVLSLRFPSLFSHTTRSPVELIDSWPTDVANTYVTFSVLALLAEIVWLIYWAYCIYRTYKKLSRLAYMKTRYVQLSFRFFVFQSFLIAVYFIFFFLLSAFWVLISTSDGSEPSIVRLWNNINVSYALRSELDGRLLFIGAFSLTLAFVYLPPGAFARESVDSITSQLTASFVLTEAERQQTVRSRRRAIRRLNRMQQSLLANVSSHKSFVFCVDLGVLLCNASLEAYSQYPLIHGASMNNSLPSEKEKSENDEIARNEADIGDEISDKLEEKSSVSGMSVDEVNFLSDAMKVVSETHSQVVDVDNVWDFSKLGLSIICQLIDEKTDTILAICREDLTRRIVLTFRGTSSSKNVMTDLKFQQISLDLETYPPETPFLLPETTGLPAIQEVEVDEESQAFQSESDIELPSPRHQRVPHTSIRRENESSSMKSAKGRLRFPFTHFLRHSSKSGPNNINNPDEQEEEDESDDEDRASARDEGGDAKPSASPSPSSSGRFSRLKHSSAGQSHRTNSMRMIEQGITDGIDLVRNTVVGVTTTAAGAVAATANAAETAALTTAQQAPLLRKFYNSRIHAGFWEAYVTVRERIHSVVREELLKEPADILVTGHSLGGALATLCALDLSIHTVQTMNQHLSAIDAKSHRRRFGHKHLQFILSHKVLNVTMYNYGSPRVGNRTFQKHYDEWVPDSFRVVVDGDIVPGIPPTKICNKTYKHIGTEILVDGLNKSGLVIIDPSFVELSLRARSKTSVQGHSLITYRDGLTSIVTGVRNYNLLKENGDSSGDVDTQVGEILMQRYDSALLRDWPLRATSSDVRRGLDPNKSSILNPSDEGQAEEGVVSASREDSEVDFFDCVGESIEMSTFGVNPEAVAEEVDSQTLDREISVYEDCRYE